jgi:hypothetical protein
MRTISIVVPGSGSPTDPGRFVGPKGLTVQTGLASLRP